MKILVVEEYGSLLDLIMALENEGHEVQWFIGDEDQRDVGDGIVNSEKLHTWSHSVKDAELIILSGSYGGMADSLKKQGKLVIGGSYDHDFTMDLARSSSMKVLKSGAQGEKTYIGAWFNGYNFCRPYFINKKKYGLMGDDKGPNIFMGIMGWFRDKSKLVPAVLNKLKVFLRASNYTGYVEVKTVSKNGTIFFDGMTTNLSNPSLLLQIELVRNPWGDFLRRLALGETKMIKATSRYGVGIQAWTLPCPVSYITRAFNGIKVKFPDNWAHIHPVQVRKDGDNTVMAGTSGNIAQVTGHANTKEVAKSRAYKTLEGISASDLMYREDLQWTF